MYEGYWGLKEKPFRNVPDPKYLYMAPQYEDAYMKMSYAICEDLGAVLLTGIFGCGKTMLLNYLEREFEKQRMKFIKLSNPQGDRIDILRNIVRQLVSHELPHTKNEIISDYLLELFESKLRDNMRDGIKTILVIDEAHLIKDEEVFEQLRLFLNYRSSFGFNITLILAGQPELKERISEFRHIEQRISLKAELKNLSREDLEGYIRHRLRVAGRAEEVFQPDVYDLIYEKSAGIPRRINTICDLALLNGMGMNKGRVDLEVMDAVFKGFLRDAGI